MIATDIANHQLRYYTYGIDVPISTNELCRVVKWRDRHVANWPKGVALYKQVVVKTGATICLAAITALSIVEFVARNILFLLLTPLMPFESINSPAVRIQQSVLDTLTTGLFCLEALKHNLVEERIGMLMIHTRLAIRIKDHYAKRV